uniref:MARVEL domain-containing protein n=1 Tax=Mola mola TaxID=94237 RepID=A0A3Q3WXL8_MOLML
IMATAEVYNPTTAPNPRSACLTVPSENLDRTRFGIKVCEVLLSLVAFVLEEVVSSCISCTALYFFEFVSCTAFLFTLLLVILLATDLHTRVGVSCWPCLVSELTHCVTFINMFSQIFIPNMRHLTLTSLLLQVFGFLASVLFFADVIFLVKSHGFPFKKGGKAESSNGSLAAAPPERERLNTATD